MVFNRFDICEAYYVFAMLYHTGQGSKEYAIFGRLRKLGFSPGLYLCSKEGLTENGLEIYRKLVAQSTPAS